jgi:hypothetical protein
MVASKAVLESLLARVRERANAPRPARAVGAPAPANENAEPLRVARAVPIAEDEIEEYEDELIEIIDDEEEEAAESAPSAAPEAIPLELSPSAPQVEMRRREAAPAPEAPTPAAAPMAGRTLAREAVERGPAPDAVVVRSRGQRLPARALTFVELLDDSLKLGG